MEGEQVTNPYDDIVIERHRQTAKWGVQNLPDGDGTTEKLYLHADAEKARCDKAHDERRCTFAHVLREEVAEALAECAPNDDAERRARLRRELIEVAAVCVQWVESIDRNTKETP